MSIVFHSRDGRSCLGLRMLFGRKQVICDTGGRRFLFEIEDPDASEGLVAEALRAAVDSRNPANRVLGELLARRIPTRPQAEG
ncbi:hypothetical protein EV663_102151 [Rhodovulum bhavnagarense]|uniref:Uncharacterized protein n=1 Tax=Rhodovulum bhavnagarense TaxID=992286 RepID=A0A4R2RJG9_9RHOB|nr:hypothetical protein [Rhodovulum bhavnagarense]TCP62307.1 hypothetical protein EV663_102151 [Rhodovulum bhavnagarense]